MFGWMLVRCLVLICFHIHCKFASFGQSVQVYVTCLLGVCVLQVTPLWLHVMVTTMLCYAPCDVRVHVACQSYKNVTCTLRSDWCIGCHGDHSYHGDGSDYGYQYIVIPVCMFLQSVLLYATRPLCIHVNLYPYLDVIFVLYMTTASVSVSCVYCNRDVKVAIVL